LLPVLLNLDVDALLVGAGQGVRFGNGIRQPIFGWWYCKQQH